MIGITGPMNHRKLVTPCFSHFDPPMELPPKFEQFSQVERIGEGQMAQVYRAFDTRKERVVALKVPKLEGDRDGRMRRRFLHEVKAATRLVHPNICRTYALVEWENLPVMVMAYVPGRTLSAVIATDGLPTDARVMSEISVIAAALGHAHAEGVIHRDLKPDNIILDSRQAPIILDFGLAKLVDSRITLTNEFLGSLSYMSPERLRELIPFPDSPDPPQVGPHSDIWSLGVIMYERLTGNLPYSAGRYFQHIRKVLYESPIRPTEIRPEIGQPLESICLRMLTADVDARYRTMGEVYAALVELMPKPPSSAAKSSVTWKPPTGQLAEEGVDRRFDRHEAILSKIAQLARSGQHKIARRELGALSQEQLTAVMDELLKAAQHASDRLNRAVANAQSAAETGDGETIRFAMLKLLQRYSFK